MKKKLIIMLALIFVFSCASQKTIEEDDFATDSAGDEIASSDNLELDGDADLLEDTSVSQDNVATNSDSSVDEFQEFESAPATSTTENSEEAKLEQELNELNAGDPAAVAESAPPPAAAEEELSLDEAPSLDNIAQNEKMTPPAESTPVEEGFPEDVLNEAAQAETPPPVIEPAPLEPSVVPPVAMEEAPANELEQAPMPEPEQIPIVDITALNYKANDNGGTVLIEATGPIEYETRKNENLNQFIIEIKNSRLPQRLARPLNTKEMVGSIGSIDAYQNNDSTVTRLVIQLREGATDPVVQLEGNRLLVVGDGPATPGANIAQNGQAANGALTTRINENGESVLLGENGEEIPLPAQTFEEFLTLTPKFVGKKISLEMDAPVNEVIKFISSESGANLIIDDQVNALAGNISFKLKDVPWDQALVTVLKLKNLVYIRQGNVLRITTQGQLEAAQKIIDDLKLKKIKEEKLVVKYFPLSYVKPSEIKTNIDNFKSKEGKVLTDDKTNSLIVTDTQEVVNQLEKIIKILDIAPSQVLIDGKVVEASENFSRSVGVNWRVGGIPIEAGAGRNGSTANLTPELNISNGGGGGSNSFTVNFGTLDVFGDISAALSLGENENKVKVISSPRVVTTNNEAARITQNNSIPITTTTLTAAGQVNTPSYIDVPLNLAVTPTVTNNGFVKMKINVERSVPGAASGTAAPPLNRRSADTNVIVKDGQTAVIGGIFSDTEINTNNGVPFLKSIPILGGLFRSQTTSKEKTELLIFVTPKVLNLDDSTRNQDFILE